MARNTRRSNNEISTFIDAWLDAASTKEVATILARRRKDWPYSVEVSSLAQFAGQLRRNGIDLAYMDNKGNSINADYFNAMIAAR